MVHLLLMGFCVGLMLALPTGPSAFMVIKQVDCKTRMQILRMVLVCIMVDLLWNLFLVTFGSVSNAVVEFLILNKELLKSWFGFILIFIGMYVFRSVVMVQRLTTGTKHTLLVSIANPIVPVTIITLILMFLGQDYFTLGKDGQLVTMIGIVFGECISWMVGISLARFLLGRQYLNENRIALVFSGVFVISGLVFMAARLFA